MGRTKFQNRYFISSIAMIVFQCLLVIPLTLSFMYQNWFWLQVPMLVCFVVISCLAAFFASLAIKQLGHSPWFGLIGLWVSIVPIVLYVIFTDKSSLPSGKSD